MPPHLFKLVSGSSLAEANGKSWQKNPLIQSIGISVRTRDRIFGVLKDLEGKQWMGIILRRYNEENNTKLWFCG